LDELTGSQSLSTPGIPTGLRCGHLWSLHLSLLTPATCFQETHTPAWKSAEALQQQSFEIASFTKQDPWARLQTCLNTQEPVPKSRQTQKSREEGLLKQKMAGWGGVCYRCSVPPRAFRAQLSPGSCILRSGLPQQVQPTQHPGGPAVTVYPDRGGSRGTGFSVLNAKPRNVPDKQELVTLSLSVPLHPS
jgi:hypothetical protein